MDIFCTIFIFYKFISLITLQLCTLKVAYRALFSRIAHFFILSDLKES